MQIIIAFDESTRTAGSNFQVFTPFRKEICADFSEQANPARGSQVLFRESSWLQVFQHLALILLG